MKLFILVIPVLLFFSEAHAGKSIGGKITQIQVRSDNRAYIKVSVKMTGNAACVASSNLARFSFKTNTDGGKSLLALALSAKAIGAKVNVYGKNTCTTYSNIEDLNYMIDMN